MPTTRPRHQVTETDRLARALDLAALHWPGESRAALLLRLVDIGRDDIEQRAQDADRRHAEAVAASAGRYPDAFGPGYLTELRADWPA